MQVGEESSTAFPSTPVLKTNTLASNPEQTEDTSPPLEMRTRNIIARTPVAGPSPASATPASAPVSAGATPLSKNTPQSDLHQVSFTIVFAAVGASAVQFSFATDQHDIWCQSMSKHN